MTKASPIRLALSKLCVLVILCPAQVFAAEKMLEAKFLASGLSPDRAAYETSFVQLVLDASSPHFGPYKFSVYANERMPIDRGIRAIEKGTLVNFFTNPLSTALEPDGRKIEIIPIPVMKGLLGYRALVVREENIEKFSKIQSTNDLTSLKAGQVVHWTDIAIYESNHLDVVTGTSIKVLFSMLDRGRFDHIPLGVTEVDQLVNEMKNDHPELSILPNTYLYYPFPVYIQVCSCAPELIERIKMGLDIAGKNGKLEALFNEHFGSTLAKIHSPNARIIKLNNPYVPNKFKSIESFSDLGSDNLTAARSF